MPTQLYLLTPPEIGGDFESGLAAALDAAEIAAVQIRLKSLPLDALRRAIDRLRPIIQASGAACILNDRPDLARATGCDGAHVGAEDSPPAEARRALGPDLQLGVSCYDSRDLAMRAGEAGADYVAFGAFFPTATKQARTVATPGLLRWWSELMELPCVAIGGITAENCAPLVEAGADFLAVSAAVWSHPAGPAAGVRALAAAIRGV